MKFLQRKGRYLVAVIALSIAFVLSVQLGERGVQFDLRHAEVSAGESGEDEYKISSLRIFNRVLLQIKENYVEPERIDPGEMFLAALDSVQNQIPEFVVRYERDEDDKTMPEKIEILVGEKEQTFEMTPMESLWEMSLRLKEVFMFVERNLPPDPEREAKDVEYAAINGLLSTLDPHSGLLPPTHYEEMQTQTGGQFGGLGIVISIRDGELTVISPIDGTPASQKGIRAQDTIVRIGEESTVNMNLNEAVNRLRGEPGTDVELWIQRANWSEPRQFTVTRDIIKIDSVDSKPLADKVGYLRIKNFQANTFNDVRSHLEELREQMGGMQGLVLDMRDNPGGLLEQSIRVSDLFLKEGTIVSTVGVGNTLRETQEASQRGTEGDYPIIVLVNGGSASASEIVAGALQKNERAVVLGDTTFGKGTVQILYEFPDDSALKLTVAQYLTPGGVSIQNTGIVPDLHTIPVDVRPDSVNLFLSQSMQRERDMDGALKNPSTRPDVGDSLRHIRYLDEEAGEEDEFVDPNEFREDFEIKLASRLLKGAGDQFRRDILLEALQGELEAVFDTELSKIQEELAQLGVDWTAGSSPSEPTYELRVESSENGAAQAGGKVELTGFLTNRSSEPLYRVKALTKSDNPLLRHREFVFGKVDPGETAEWTINVDIPQDSRSRHDRIEFSVSDDVQDYAGKHNYDLVIEGKEQPHYAFTYEITNDNNDGVLRVGDKINLRVHLQNQGTVTGADTTLYLKNLTGNAIYLDSGRGVVSDLGPGASQSVDFECEVRRMPSDNKVTMEIDVYDAGYRDFVQKKFTLPVVEGERNVEDWQGSATVGNAPATLYVGASADTDPIATAASGATLPVTARSGDWLKVQLDGRSGWVENSNVTASEGASGELSGIERMMWFQKPRVSLSPSSMLTSQRAVKLEGFIEDDWNIQDYYIIVHRQDGPGQVRTRKLNYQAVGAQRAEVSTDVPLFDGMNRISVVTRNDAGISTTETIYVYRE